MQTPIFSISSEAFKRMVLKGKGAEIIEKQAQEEIRRSGQKPEGQKRAAEIHPEVGKAVQHQQRLMFHLFSPSL